MEGLDGLRGIAAAAIVLLHVWMFSGADQPWQPEQVDRVIGTFGVSLVAFFVLSGFLVAAPWLRAARERCPVPSAGRYARRRIVRIMPGYLACLVGSYLVMRIVDHPLAVDAEELPIFLLFGQNQFSATAGQLNPPLWSLAVEAMFYVAMPSLGLAMVLAVRRLPRTGVPLMLAIVVVAGWAWSAFAVEFGEERRLINALPTYMPVFACGIAAAWWAGRGGVAVASLAQLVLLVLGSAIVAADAWWHAGGTGLIGHVVRDFPAGIGFGLIVVSIASGGARVLGTLPFVRLGLYSYGIYLWHMPVLYVLRASGYWPQSPWIAYVMVLGAALVLGAASWHLLERPATVWASRRGRREPLAPPRAALSSSKTVRRDAVKQRIVPGGRLAQIVVDRADATGR
ncbi:MAG: acyltransferase [Patulibacter sp.]